MEGESGIKYTYNNGHPKLASTSFLKALERIPFLIDNHERLLEKAAKDIPVLEEVVNSRWRKEDELRKLKSDLAALDRKIQMTIGENSADTKMQNKNSDMRTPHGFIEKKAIGVAEAKSHYKL